MMGFKGARALQKPWTDDEVEALQRLHAEGLSASKIASCLGRSRNSVLSKWHGINLPARKDGSHAATVWTEEKLVALRRYHAEDLTQVGIAEQMGLTRQQVKRQMAKIGLRVSGKVRVSRSPAAELEPEAACDSSGIPYTLLTIPNSGLCKWPHGDVSDVDFHLCGNPCDGSAYCPHHHARAHTPHPMDKAA